MKWNHNQDFDNNFKFEQNQVFFTLRTHTRFSNVFFLNRHVLNIVFDPKLCKYLLLNLIYKITKLLTFVVPNI